MGGRSLLRWMQRGLLLSICLALLLSGSTAHAAFWQKAQVRIVHASPDAPAVDIYLNGKKAVSNLAYQRTTDYLRVRPGRYRVRVTPAGAAPEKAVIDAQVTLRGNQAYTVAAVGKLSQIRPLVLMDQLRPAAEGQAQIRVIHASPDTPAVDVAVTDGPVLIRNLSFPNTSQYVPVRPGTYSLEVRPAGTTNVALAVPNFRASAGTSYTIFAMGESGAGTLQAVPFVDAPRRR